VATFETRPQSAAEVAERISSSADHPFIVAELDGR
jgi:hypothetical protein